MEKEESKHTETESKKSKNGKLKDIDDSTLEELILDTPFNKYDAILLARRWAYELKAKDGEIRSLQELIAVATRDILGIRVDFDMVRGLPTVKSMRKPKGLDKAAVLENLHRIGTDKESKK